MGSIAQVLGRPLASGERCPVLYRYPGPCGLALWFAGKLERLAPGDVLWMSARAITADSYGARFFGTLLVRRPLDFEPRLHAPGIYVAENRPLSSWDDVTWVGRDRGAAIDALCRYLEELDALRRSGAPGPGVAWCRVPVEERRRTLRDAGLAGVWTESDPWYNAVP